MYIVMDALMCSVMCVQCGTRVSMFRVFCLKKLRVFLLLSRYTAHRLAHKALRALMPVYISRASALVSPKSRPRSVPGHSRTVAGH
jgi:hypothetical protein